MKTIPVCRANTTPAVSVSDQQNYTATKNNNIKEENKEINTETIQLPSLYFLG